MTTMTLARVDQRMDMLTTDSCMSWLGLLFPCLIWIQKLVMVVILHGQQD